MSEQNKTKQIKGKKIQMSQVFTKEGRVIPVTLIKADDDLNVEMENTLVTLIGKSKGHGFSGVMKKWGFKGAMATRGQSDKPRAPGSIGAQTPGRVLKGKKMAGRYGNNKVTLKGLRVVKVDIAKKELMVTGPVPGARNSEVLIRFAGNQ